MIKKSKPIDVNGVQYVEESHHIEETTELYDKAKHANARIEKLKTALDEICQITYTGGKGWSHTPYCKQHMKQYAEIHAIAARVLREIDSTE